MIKPDDLLLGEPTPDDVIAARVRASLTQGQCADLAGVGAQPRWAEYENGKRMMPSVRWAVFLLLTDQHPRLRIVGRRVAPK